MSFEITNYGNPHADTLLIQMVDDYDLKVIENEVSYIRQMTGGQDFCLKAIKVANWNHDLSPWSAPAVFGTENFEDGAPKTLEFLLDLLSDIIPCPENTEQTAKKIFLGGYSLAGLFALWAGYQTNRFDGIAAASPSIWFPSFTKYMRENTIRVETVYLSLGDREERTRNPVMAEVGNAIREAEIILRDAGTNCTLEWNKGNHFKEPDLRTAKAFAWLMGLPRPQR